MQHTKKCESEEKVHTTGKYMSSVNRNVFHSKGPKTGCNGKICVFGKKSIFVWYCDFISTEQIKRTCFYFVLCVRTKYVGLEYLLTMNNDILNHWS